MTVKPKSKSGFPVPNKGTARDPNASPGYPHWCLPQQADLHSREWLGSVDPVLRGSYTARQELLGSMDPILQGSYMAWQTPREPPGMAPRWEQTGSPCTGGVGALRDE